jgi:hypothetical protein
MLPAISPPTDSLYKFTAIGGLVIFVAGLVYPQLRMENLDARYREMDKTFREFSEAADGIRPAIKEMADSLPFKISDREIDSHQLLLAIAAWKKTATPEEVSRVLTKIEASAQKFDQPTRNMMRSLGDLSMDVEDFQRARANVNWWKWFCYPSAGIGLLLSLWGFRMWHTRSQVHQDAMLKEQRTPSKAAEWTLEGGEVVRDENAHK